MSRDLIRSASHRLGSASSLVGRGARGDRPELSEREVWFEIRRTPGRIRAYPVHWKGFAVLVGVFMVPAASTGAAAALAPGWSPWPIAATLVPSMAVSLYLLVRAIRRHSREHPR